MLFVLRTMFLQQSLKQILIVVNQDTVYLRLDEIPTKILLLFLHKNVLVYKSHKTLNNCEASDDFCKDIIIYLLNSTFSILSWFRKKNCRRMPRRACLTCCEVIFQTVIVVIHFERAIFLYCMTDMNGVECGWMQPHYYFVLFSWLGFLQSGFYFGVIPPF